MKKAIITIITICVMAMSCNKNNQIPSEMEGAKFDDITLSVDAGVSVEIDTKSTSASANESTIKKAMFMVFNSVGELVASASTTSSSTTLRLPLGIAGYKVYAVVNYAAELSDVQTETALLSKVSNLSDCSMDSFEMIGSVGNLTFAKGTPVSVGVSRFVSKVQLDKVTNALTGSMKSLSLKINDVYLINVSGSCPYSMKPSTVSTWYNQRKDTKGTCKALISSNAAIDVAVTSDTPYSTAHYFYCYPNPTTVDSQSTSTSSFDPRFTRLVVEATLGTTKYYYPVNIVDMTEQGGLGCNKKYEITELRIVGPGTLSPDIPVNKESISLKMTVTGWQTGFSTSFEI